MFGPNIMINETQEAFQSSNGCAPLKPRHKWITTVEQETKCLLHPRDELLSADTGKPCSHLIDGNARGNAEQKGEIMQSKVNPPARSMLLKARSCQFPKLTGLQTI
jgi:hypothetical protein